jgi:hypothetical protein
MTTESKAREIWKHLYQTEKGSDAERKAYQSYVQIRQGMKPDKAEKRNLNKQIKQISQPDIKGLSAAETFTLVNPVTEISRPLPRQERPQQANLF